MIVTMTRHYGSLFSGERASFTDDEARSLIERGIAAPVTKPISGVTKDVPAASATPPPAATEQTGAEKPAESAGSSESADDKKGAAKKAK